MISNKDRGQLLVIAALSLAESLVVLTTLGCVRPQWRAWGLFTLFED